MVDKRRRIASRPATPPPTADGWVTSGGLDPELQNQPIIAPNLEPEPAQPTEEKGKAFPHRISFDMDRQQYRRLKRASFDSDRPMNDILREAVEEWLKAHES